MGRPQLGARPTRPADALRLQDLPVYRLPDPSGVAATDTAALQAALNTPGTWVAGRGDYLATPDVLSAGADNVTIVGQGGQATRLLKAGAGRLLDLSGTPTSFATMRKRVRLADLQLNGQGNTGDLIRAYYSQFLTFDRVLFENNNGEGVNGLQFWDSLFNRCSWDYVHGSIGGGTGAAVHLKINDQGVSSGFGYSDDNCNNINFLNCRWEINQGLDVWFDGRRYDGTYNFQKINECTFTGRTKIEYQETTKAKGMVLLDGVDDITFDSLQTTLNGVAGSPVDMVKIQNATAVDLGQYRPEVIERAGATVRTALSVGASSRNIRGEVFMVAQPTNRPTVAMVEFTGTERQGNNVKASYLYNPGGSPVFTGAQNTVLDAAALGNASGPQIITATAYAALATKDPGTLYAVIPG